MEEESKKQDNDYTITFEIKTPNCCRESCLNTIILLIRDFKQLEHDRDLLDYKDFKQYNNDIIDALHKELFNLETR